MATYIYAVTTADHPLPDDAAGVGDPPTQLRTIRGSKVAAVVGDAPEDLRARRRDVAAHHNVLTALAERGPVLPMRFGMVVADDAGARTLVEEYGAEYEAALDHLAGMAELNVKAEVDLDTVLPDIVAADPRIAEQRAHSRATGTLDAQMRLGELVAEGLAHREEAIRELLLRKLAPLSAEAKDGPAVRDVAANNSFLVRAEDVGAFRKAVDELPADTGPGVRFRCAGPLPAYSFTPQTVADE
jgi:hypothetical protein